MPDLFSVLASHQQVGFIGDGPLEPHFEHAAGFATAVEAGLGRPPARVVDLGSGGGLPGLVLAVRCWPQTSVTLLDASEQRTDALLRAVSDLGLEGRVEVYRGRAEVVSREPARRQAYDAVVARSFGPPAVVAECATGFLQPGGVLVVSEPPQASGDRWAHDEGLAQLGLDLGPRLEDQGHRFQILRSNGSCSDRFPRRDGVPAKRPLF